MPEALVRGDYSLVRRFLEPFLLDPPERPADIETAEQPNLDGQVPGWKEGGRTYLLFLSQPDHPHLLAKAMQAVQALARRVHNSSRLRAKKLLRLAVAEMESRLTVLAKANTASKVSSSAFLFSFAPRHLERGGVPPPLLKLRKPLHLMWPTEDSLTC